MTLSFYHVNVFTPVPFTGNPAGVICGSEAFSDEEMRLLAREIALPGNAFVWQAESGGNDFHVRFFTPVREVSLSGHTALASAHSILTEALAEDDFEFLTLRTRTTHLAVEREGERLWLTLPLPDLRDFAGKREEVATLLGLAASALGPDLPLQLTPENDLIIPLAQGVKVLEATPNSSAIADFGKRTGIRGLFIFSLESEHPDVRTRGRFFAPHFGIPEDIATGSIHASLMIYLWRLGLIKANSGRATLVGEQGEALGRGSRIHVDLRLSGDNPQRVRVGGEVVTVLRGAVTRPPV